MMCCEFRLLKVARVLTLLIAGLSEEVLPIVVLSLAFGHRMSGSEIAWLVLTLTNVAWYSIFRHGCRGATTLAFVDDELRPIED